MCGIHRGQSFEEEARKLREEDERKRRQEIQATDKAKDQPTTGKAKEKARELVNS